VYTPVKVGKEILWTDYTSAKSMKTT